MDRRIWNFVEDLMQMMFGLNGVNIKRFNSTLKYLQIKVAATKLIT
jgi:hypothetical protein